MTSIFFCNRSRASLSAPRESKTIPDVRTTHAYIIVIACASQAGFDYLLNLIFTNLPVLFLQTRPAKRFLPEHLFLLTLRFNLYSEEDVLAQSNISNESCTHHCTSVIIPDDRLMPRVSRLAPCSQAQFDACRKLSKFHQNL